MKWLGALLSSLIGLQAHAVVYKTYDANLRLPPVNLKSVLITSFNWADMDLQNASIAAAGRLRANLEMNGAHVNVCFLPVIYDVASQVAMNCFNQLTTKPDIVLSLGEAGVSAGQLEVILAAANLDNETTPDDRGDVRANHVIDKNFPADVSLHIPQKTLAPMVTSKEIYFRPHDAGGYICNNTAFHLYNEMHARKIPYMFVHIAALPQNGYNNLGELDESVGIQSGDLLTKMLSLLTTTASSLL